MYNQPKKRILVAPLNWGLGHATRCIPLIQALVNNHFEPVIASDGVALKLLQKEFPELETVELPSYNITYAKKGQFFKLKMLQNSPKLIKAIKAEKKALNVARDKKVDVLIFDIIYKMIEYLEDLLQSKREAVVTWKKTGEAVVRKIFDIKGLGIIVGCYLRDGVCSRNSKVECVRNNQVLGEGMINSLQRERKVVKEIHAGYEFAFITKDDFQDWQEDDTIICYTQTKE